MKDLQRVVTFSRSTSEGGGKDADLGSQQQQQQHEQPESPTSESQKRNPPSRTSSGKFEDPMLVWRSSQSDGACPSPSAGHVPASPTHSGKAVAPGPQSSPTTSSKHLNFRAIETLLDAVPCSSPSPHSPHAPLASPVRSQSPTPLSIRAPSSAAAGTNSSASSVSPTAMFERLRLNGSRSPLATFVSEGGMRSAHSKSLTFSGAEDIAMADRSYSYTFSTTDPNGMTPLPGDIIGPTHERVASPFLHHPPLPRSSFSRSTGGSMGSADAAAAAAIAAAEGDRDRASGGGGGGGSADAAMRNLLKMKSMGGRSMGGRALSINPCWRSGGALTLSSAVSGAQPEGGLQSQTHEALQQLLAANTVAEPSPNKRFSAPGQGFNGAAPAPGLQGGPHLGAGTGTGIQAGIGGRRASRDLGAALSSGNALLGRGEQDAEDVGDGPSSGGLGSSTPPSGKRRFSRSLTEKLDERLALHQAVELSYADTPAEDGNDDDVF